MDSELKQYLDEFRGRFQQVDAQFQQMREDNTAAHEETRRVLRGEMAEMRGEVRGEMAEVRGEMAEMRGEVRGEIAEMTTTLRGEIGEMTTTLRGEIAEMTTTLRGEIGEMGTSLRGEITEAVSTLRGEMRAEHAETRRHFDVVAEGLDTRIDRLAEAVQLVDLKVDRQADDIRAEMRQGFADRTSSASAARKRRRPAAPNADPPYRPCCSCSVAIVAVPSRSARIPSTAAVAAESVVRQVMLCCSAVLRIYVSS